MTISIQTLKRNYKINLALGKTLPTYDLATPLPLSTGNPLYDAALTDKVTMTTTLNEAEHLNRAWFLVNGSGRDEQQTLANHAPGLLNDYKMLLALHCWAVGEEELTRTFLQAMPWHWRLAFPIAVLKPASHFFTGWRCNLTFRFVNEPRYPALRQLFRELLAQAPPVAILKYRQTIQAAAALQRYRFEGEREQWIHDLCFNNGRTIAGSQNVLEPIGTYLQARQLLNDLPKFLAVLNAGRAEIPLTSYMGLLGQAGIRLNDETQPQRAGLRDYAVRCATAVESLLRLQEWGGWLTERQAQRLGAKVQQTIIERGVTIPYAKVMKAFINAPLKVRRMVLQPLLLPLLAHFGRQTAGLLPPPAPLTMIQPGNVIHLMSFLLYTVLSSAMATRFFLLYTDGAEEVPPLDIGEVASHLADSPEQMSNWLLQEFGGLATQFHYTYDFRAIAKTIGQLDPAGPLLLDLPFAQNMELLAALLPFERVFNLNIPFGAPGEICVAYDYYATFSLQTPHWHFGIWERFSDSAAQRFAEFLDRLHYFQLLAG